MKIHTNHYEGLIMLRDSHAKENEGEYNLYGEFMVEGNIVSIFGMTIGNQSSHRMLNIEFVSKDSNFRDFERIPLNIPSGYFEIVDGDETIDTYMSYHCSEKIVILHLRDEGMENRLDIFIER